VNIGYGSKIGYWAGWVVPEDTPLLLLGDAPAHAQEAAAQLLRVGLDRTRERSPAGSRRVGAGLPIAQIDQMSVEASTRPSRATKRCASSTSVAPSGGAPRRRGYQHARRRHLRARELSEDAVIATICEGGYCSSLAASLLANEGFPRLINAAGGMAAYRALGGHHEPDAEEQLSKVRERLTPSFTGRRTSDPSRSGAC
jgi:rhodanese-related sulfurtransferase